MDPEQALREIISEASATSEPIPPMLRAAIERGQKAIDDYYDDLAKHAGEHAPDPNLHCDQCGKPQWDNGSGLCSWHACAPLGSCDGKQYRNGPAEAERQGIDLDDFDARR